jgi:hypothetical protein
LVARFGIDAAGFLTENIRRLVVHRDDVSIRIAGDERAQLRDTLVTAVHIQLRAQRSDSPL